MQKYFMQRVNLYLRNNSSENNKSIIEFLNQYIDRINSKKFYIDFNIIDDDEIDDYIKKGITKLPLLVTPNNRYTGSAEIQSAFMKVVNFRVQKKKPDENEYHNWISQEMTLEAAKRDAEDPDEASREMEKTKQRAMEMQSRREKMFSREQKKLGMVKDDAKISKQSRNDNIELDDHNFQASLNNLKKSADDEMLMSRFEETF